MTASRSNSGRQDVKGNRLEICGDLYLFLSKKGFFLFTSLTDFLLGMPMDEDVIVGAAAVTYIAITYATNILKKEERKRQKAF